MRSISLRLWLLAIVSAILQAVPFPMAGPVPVWRRGFCWIALVPLIVALLAKLKQRRIRGVRGTAAKRRPRIPLRPAQTALLGYCCGVLWYLANCYWIYQTMYLYGDLPKPAAAAILVLFALYLGLYHALFGWLVGLLHRRLGRGLTLLAVPFLWVAVELARARITGFPWDLLGYTQVDNSVMTMFAPIGGVMLLSFIIALGSTLLAGACLARTVRAFWWCAIAGVLLVGGLQAGVMYHPAEDQTSHTATLLQENLAVGAVGREVAEFAAVEKYKQFRAWSQFPQLPVAKGAGVVDWAPSSKMAPRDFIIWPEAPADFATSDPLFRVQLNDLARSTGTPVIAGAVGVDADLEAEDGYREFGSAAIFDKNGSYLGRYDKIHRVPWGEYVPYRRIFSFADKLVAGVGRMDAGTETKVFQANGHTFGVFICYESIFGDEVREFVKNGAEVLVNISDDGWYGDTGAPWQHLDMARMRAIENHRWILRDTNTGVTTAIDPHGRGIFTTPRHVRTAFVFPFDYSSDVTFYTRHGDWFAWVCAFISAIFLGFSLRRQGTVH
jgi:apolipoprotein N-acyltransferase